MPNQRTDEHGWKYEPLRDDAELHRAWGRSADLAFRFDPEIMKVYLERLDTQNWCRALLDESGALAGTLERFPMGMFVNGSRVGCECVALVTVLPEHRGRRASVYLMQEHLREARREGNALSALFSARARLYRGVGYEISGRSSEIIIPTRSIGLQQSDVDEQVLVRPMTPEDEPEMRRVYTEFAQPLNGYLDRGDWFWNFYRGVYAKRLREGFIFEREGKVTGYAIVQIDDYIGHKAGSKMRANDLAFTDPQTARAMLKFFSGFSSTRSEIIVMGDLTHPILDELDEVWYRLNNTNVWMVRIVDLEKAIAERGFNPCVTGEVVVEITDELFDENNGVWNISVGGGKGSIKRTDEPAQARLDIGTFAPIYTGYQSASQLTQSSRISGNADAIKVLDGLFTAPTPTMADDF